MKLKYLIISILFILIPINILANENVNIYVFHNYNCSYCQKALDYFYNLQAKDTSIHLFDYELLEDSHAFNRSNYNKVLTLLNINKQSVPLIIIGNEYLIGFSPSIQEEIEKKLIYYKENNYEDIVGLNLGVIDKNGNYLINNSSKEYYANTIFGKINLTNKSLLVSTLILGIINSFNVYSVIGIILLILIINIKNKRNSWIIFLSYIGWFSFIYFIDIMSWFNINDYLDNIPILKTIIISLSIILAGINLYYYIKKKKFNNTNNISLFFPITGIIILSTITSLLFILKNNNSSLMYIELLNNNNLTGNSFMRYIIFYLSFFNITNIIIFLIIKVISNKNLFIKLDKYTSLIKAIIFILISIIILII